MWQLNLFGSKHVSDQWQTLKCHLSTRAARPYNRHTRIIRIYQSRQRILNRFITRRNDDSTDCSRIFSITITFYSEQIERNDPNLPASVHRLTAIEYRHVIPPRDCEQHGRACANARFSCTRLEPRHYDNLDNKSRGTCIPTSNGVSRKVPRESKAGRARAL